MYLPASSPPAHTHACDVSHGFLSLNSLVSLRVDALGPDYARILGGAGIEGTFSHDPCDHTNRSAACLSLQCHAEVRCRILCCRSLM